jgi:hypothetical protein
MKQIILVTLLFLVGFISLVYAYQSEVQAPIYKGWNLLYGFFSPDQLAGQLEQDNIKAVYAFIPRTQQYARAYPNPEMDKLRMMDDDELLNTAFWVYSDKTVSGILNGVDHAEEYMFETEIRPFSERQIYRGYNFIGITPDMVGKNLLEMEGSCNIEKAYLWIPNYQDWTIFPLQERDDFPREMLMLGLVIKVSSDCIPGEISRSPVIPPQIPGDNLNQIGDRKRVENYYYEEYAYEDCDLNEAKNYNSKLDCEAAWRCLAEEYSKLIPEGDLGDLAEYMEERGGEGGSIYYSDKNPSVNEQLTTKYDKCLSGRYKDY